MTRNKMTDLNDHLFAELERLGDEDMTQDELDAEIKRAKAITGVAQQVIANAGTCLEAARFEDSKLDRNLTLPSMLGSGAV